jgi:serine/threonine-protein kinase
MAMPSIVTGMRFSTAIPVGSGGSSRILRAFDAQRGVEVALKLLHQDDPALVERLRREVAIQAGLRHPNIVPIHEIVDYQGRPCAVMPLLDGERLDQASAALSLHERLALMLPVIDAVHAAHRAGLVHRDLKPANVLVVKDAEGRQRPMVLDFGVALDTTDRRLTATGEVVGTPGYLSPEQAAGRTDVDLRSDIFSLGVMLYELIAERPPFAADSAAASLMAVLQHEPPSLRARLPHLDAALERIVMQCLEKQPGWRYPSAQALHEDLQAFLAGRPVRARTLGLRYRLRRLLRRSPVLATALAAGILLLLSSAALGLHGLWQAQRSAALAGELSRLAADLGRDMQLLQMRPAHDIGPVRAQLRERLEPLQRAVLDSDAKVRTAAAEPLGLALLALGSDSQALPLLEQAWQSLPASEIAGDCRRCTLAVALGGIHERAYRESLTRLVGIAEIDLRQAEAERLQLQLLQPALSYLRPARNASGEAGLLATALLDYHQPGATAPTRQAAIELLQQRAAGSSLSPLILAAELRLALAVAAVASQTPDLAEALDAAEVGFLELIDIARSLPQARLGLCAVAEMRVRQGTASSEQETAASNRCAAAHALDPADPRLLLALAQAQTSIARASTMRGQDPAPLVAAVRANLAELVRQRDPRAHMSLAQALLAQAHFRRSHGADDVAALYREAAELADAAVRANPGDLDMLLGLAAISLQIATRNNHDPAIFEPAYVNAAELLVQADARFPQAAGVALRRGELYAWWGYARHLTDADAAPLLRAAIEWLQPLEAARPQDVPLLSRLAFAHWSLGEYLSDGGEDGQPDLAAAEDLYQRAQALQPQRFVTAFNLLSVRLQRSRGRLLAGLAAHDLLQAADRGLSELEAAQQPVGILRATWQVLQAHNAQLSGEPWRTAAARAGGLLEAALAQDQDRASAAAQWIYLQHVVLDGEAIAVARLRQILNQAGALHSEFNQHGSLALHYTRLVVRAAEVHASFSELARQTVADLAQRHPRRFAAWAQRFAPWMSTAQVSVPEAPKRIARRTYSKPLAKPSNG